MAYLPSMESGGVDTTTIRHLIPSCRHQLSSIALMESSILTEVDDTSILRTGLSTDYAVLST
jgi:hypothetical protein